VNLQVSERNNKSWTPLQEILRCIDADYAGDRIERKSTSGNCQFLGENLISWDSKRQAIIAMSTAEAEYISAASCCTQLVWMKH
jgi:hypothetical protein